MYIGNYFQLNKSLYNIENFGPMQIFISESMNRLTINKLPL